MEVTDIIARWTDWAGEGIENCRIRIDATGIRIDSAVVAPPVEGFATRYALTCDPHWRVFRTEVEVVGAPGRVVLVADGKGNWTDGDGKALPDLSGAVDIDIAVTPFTNTLPVRRLGLAVGEEAVIDIVYIEPPMLTVRRRPQRYRRIAPNSYRFETLDFDFTADIEMDGDSLVTLYPALFRRVDDRK